MLRHLLGWILGRALGYGCYRKNPGAENVDATNLPFSLETILRLFTRYGHF